MITHVEASCTASIVHRLSHTHYNLSNPPPSSLTPTQPSGDLSHRFREFSLQCCAQITGPTCQIRCPIVGISRPANEGVKLPGLDSGGIGR